MKVVTKLEDIYVLPSAAVLSLQKPETKLANVHLSTQLQQYGMLYQQL